MTRPGDPFSISIGEKTQALYLNPGFINLPENTDIASFSSKNLSSISKLANAYCAVMEATDVLLVEKLSRPIAVFASLTSSEYAAVLLDSFYSSDSDVLDENIDTLVAFIDELREIPEASSDAIFMGACGTVLLSADIIFDFTRLGE